MTLHARKTPDIDSSIISLGFGAIGGIDKCQPDFDWPVSLPEGLARQEDAVSRYVAMAEASKDTENTNLLMTGGMLSMVMSLHYLELAFYVDAAVAAGLEISSSDPYMPFLLGNCALGDVPTLQDFRYSPRSRPRLGQLQDARTSLRINRPLSLRKVFCPDAVTFTAEPVIRDAMNKFGFSARYLTPERIFPTNRELTDIPTVDVSNLVEQFAQTVVRDRGLSRQMADRLKPLIARDSSHVFSNVARQLAWVRQRSLPKTLWSGSGGRHANRVIGCAAMCQGSKVVRVHHGASGGMLRANPNPARIVELWASSRYVLPTRAFADVAQKSGHVEDSAISHHCEIDHLNGDPSFGRLYRTSPPRTRKRRRVVYAPTALRGIHQYLSPYLPDGIYLGWQMRLVSMLSDMPIDLTCMPHPLGALPRMHHPLKHLAPENGVFFEDVICDAEVIILDHFQTTTMAQALCTSIPVVFLDITNIQLLPAIDQAFRDRCRVVPVKTNPQNQPVIDRDVLRDAILGDGRKADPGFFLNLYANQ